jgi:hypothetical protein
MLANLMNNHEFADPTLYDITESTLHDQDDFTDGQEPKPIESEPTNIES